MLHMALADITSPQWFDLNGRQEEAFRPSSIPSVPVKGWGDHRIQVSGVDISFSYEDPGIQVCIEVTWIRQLLTKL